MTEAGLRLITRFEGYRRDAYPDAIHGWSVPTIGYGTTRYANGQAVRPGDQLSEPKARKELAAYVDKRLRPALELVPGWGDMSEPQQGALESFGYNLGGGFYGSPDCQTITRCLREKAWTQVDEAMLLYCNPGTAAHVGLLRRRKAEADAWNYGLKQLGAIVAPATVAPREKLPAPPPAASAVRQRMRPGDLHLVIDGGTGSAKAYGFDGAMVFRFGRVRCRGVGGHYRNRSGDTPPGLYQLAYYQPTLASESYATKIAYGMHFFDLWDIDGQERNLGRAGIGFHGGGSAAPFPLDPRQLLVDTLGCVRAYNEDLAAWVKLVVPRFFPVKNGGRYFPDPKGPKLFATVFQPY